MKVLFFSADWCNSCRKMHPVFESLVNRFEKSPFKFKVIDVESEVGVELSSERQVRNVPTILILDNKGHEIERFCGTQNYETLVENLKKYIK